MSFEDILLKKQRILDELDELEQLEIEQDMEEFWRNSSSGSEVSASNFTPRIQETCDPSNKPEISLDAINERERELQAEIVQLEKEIEMRKTLGLQSTLPEPTKRKKPRIGIPLAYQMDRRRKRSASTDDEDRCPAKKNTEKCSDSTPLECPFGRNGFQMRKTHRRQSGKQISSKRHNQKNDRTSEMSKSLHLEVQEAPPESTSPVKEDVQERRVKLESPEFSCPSMGSLPSPPPPASPDFQETWHPGYDYDCVPAPPPDSEEEEFEMRTEFETDPFRYDKLPDGWRMVTHDTGLPMYCHTQTRVISVSRPYSLGQDSTRHHRIPVYAIPCLRRKKIIEASRLERRDARNVENSTSDNERRTEVTVERVEDVFLPPEDVQEYMSSIFETKEFKGKTSKTLFRERCQREAKRMEYASKVAEMRYDDSDRTEGATKTADGSFLISINPGNAERKAFLMNPIGLQATMILGNISARGLHGRVEYRSERSTEDEKQRFYSCTIILKMQKIHRDRLSEAMKRKLAQFKETESTNPDEDHMIIAQGRAIWKQEAKQVAAENALKELIGSSLLFNKEHIAVTEKNANGKESIDQTKEIDSFESLTIEDPRVLQMCSLFEQPQPIKVLETAGRRFPALSGSTPLVKQETVNEYQTKVTVTIGSFSHTVTSKKMKLGKHLAAQGILKQLYPHLTYYFQIIQNHKTALAQEVEHLEVSELLDVPIDYPSVGDVCGRKGMRGCTPFELLKIACKRSKELQGVYPQLTKEVVDPTGSVVVTITAGPYIHTVRQQGVKQGKHLAAQAILKEMHPEICTYWNLLQEYFDVDAASGKVQFKRPNETACCPTATPTSDAVMESPTKSWRKPRNFSYSDRQNYYRHEQFHNCNNTVSRKLIPSLLSLPEPSM